MVRKKIVMPGDVLATAEELTSGDGTFEEDGLIKASRLGEYVVDEKSRIALVTPLTDVPTVLKNGDVVFAEVKNVKNQMVIVDVLHVIDRRRGIAGGVNGTIRVSEIAKGYVKEAGTEYKNGDIIKAKVIQVTPSLQLSTKGKEYGVIRALCSVCRAPLDKVGDHLECKQCGNRERRKMSVDYGKGHLSL